MVHALYSFARCINLRNIDHIDLLILYNCSSTRCRQSGRQILAHVHLTYFFLVAEFKVQPD